MDSTLVATSAFLKCCYLRCGRTSAVSSILAFRAGSGALFSEGLCMCVDGIWLGFGISVCSSSGAGGPQHFAEDVLSLLHFR